MTTTFEEWMALVDSACLRACGLSIHDLTDQPFRDLYNDGVSPTAVARGAIRNEFS